MLGAMLSVPLRLIFRSRYAALIWAFGICMTAYDFASGSSASVDAANAADANGAQIEAALAGQ